MCCRDNLVQWKDCCGCFLRRIVVVVVGVGVVVVGVDGSMLGGSIRSMLGFVEWEERP